MCVWVTQVDPTFATRDIDFIAFLMVNKNLSLGLSLGLGRSDSSYITKLT